MSPRHSSGSSGSESSGDEHSKKWKDKKEKKYKKKDKKKDKMYNDNYGGFSDLPTSPSFPNPHGGSSYHHSSGGPPSFPSHESGGFPSYGDDHRSEQHSYRDHNSSAPSFAAAPPPPAAAAPRASSNAPPPPSGYRIPLDTSQPFPSAHQLGPPPCSDAGGEPIYIGSAIFTNPPSVHPCKIGQHLIPTPVAVPFGGQEYSHTGRYDLLPFDPQTMEWVRTSGGRIPSGRRPIQGGYEADGAKLYHARADVASVIVPGKAGEHLSGATIPFGCQEHSVSDSYEILCWRY